MVDVSLIHVILWGVRITYNLTCSVVLRNAERRRLFNVDGLGRLALGRIFTGADVAVRPGREKNKQKHFARRVCRDHLLD